MKHHIIGTIGLLAPLSLFGAETGHARELEDILAEKGVISDEEAAESRSAHAPKGTALYAHWDNGIRLTSSDGKAFKLKIGGRIQNDWAYIAADDEIEAVLDDEFGSGTEFRRARFYFEGKVHGRITFKAEYDFADGEASWNDVYLGLLDVPLLGLLRIGHIKEPFSLELQTSSKYITFMERGLPNELSPGRNTGFGFTRAIASDRLTYAAGVFRETDDFGDGFGDADTYNLTSRLTGLLLYANDGRQLVHLGFAYSFKNIDDEDFRVRARPEVHLSPVRFVDTGSFAADTASLVGGEAAAVFGPVSIQGEYIGAFVDSDERSDPDLSSFYVYASYFLTGENRVYKAGNGAFDRVKPNHDAFDDAGGLGAWELGLRYSYLDLDDVGGGELQDITAGLNWHLNPNVRFMLNYVYANLDRDFGIEDEQGDVIGFASVDEAANAIQARFQIDF